MSTSEAKKLYETLLESGELKILYSSMKGSWEKDRTNFIKQHEENQELIRNSSLYIDLDDNTDELTDGF